MTDKEIIEMLLQQLADAKAEIKTLHGIIENYSKQETKVINDIKVNSYNGSTATAEADGRTNNYDNIGNLNSGTAEHVGNNNNNVR